VLFLFIHLVKAYIKFEHFDDLPSSQKIVQMCKVTNTTLLLVVAYFDCHLDIFVPKTMHKVSKEPNTLKVTRSLGCVDQNGHQIALS
jgi:hypothetical protein